ncbi:unnamed protein product [Amoebophrya sp. A120]|nr:unnamed protein product [Amoebophrya sp. A120]|eukprot:GSA120T00001215001.1
MIIIQRPAGLHQASLHSLHLLSCQITRPESLLNFYTKTTRPSVSFPTATIVPVATRLTGKQVLSSPRRKKTRGFCATSMTPRRFRTKSSRPSLSGAFPSSPCSGHCRKSTGKGCFICPRSI